MSGCAYLHHASREEQQITHAYNDALGHWTKSAHDYAQFETQLIVTATLKEPEFLEAYVRKWAWDTRMPADQQAKFRVEKLQAEEKFIDLLLVIYVPDKSLSDTLDQKNSPWGVYLLNDTGQRVAAEQIERELDEDHTLALYFPYYNVWSSAFHVRFPREQAGLPVIGANTRRVTLQLTSAFGTCEMVWPLSPQKNR
jgi:hypothetical protein